MGTPQFWITTAAVLFSPLIAVQVQKWLEMAREKRQRRASVFYTLMATRTVAARVSPTHVEALNRIDIEFYGNSRQEREILSAWRMYLDHLNTPYEEKDFPVWAARGEELFVDLLYQMGKSLGYDFDKVHLKRGIYSPIAHSRLEIEAQAMRDNLAKVLSGEQAVTITVAKFSTDRCVSSGDRRSDAAQPPFGLTLATPDRATEFCCADNQVRYGGTAGEILF